jgi:hypothetical protein
LEAAKASGNAPVGSVSFAGTCRDVGIKLSSFVTPHYSAAWTRHFQSMQ